MKNRNEQIFVLIMASMSLFMILCMAGCGGGESCESVKCGSYEEEGDATIHGVSIPGCGGCLTSGRGCGSCLWPQSCKMIYGDIEYDDGPTIAAVDTQYFTNGCLGCGQSEESCYGGCMTQDIQNWGCIYGSSESEEGHMIGCSDGCGKCVADNSLYAIAIMEEAANIR